MTSRVAAPRDYDRAVADANLAMARAEAGVTEDWKERFLDAVVVCAMEYPEFTMDEVWDLVDPPSSGDTRACGPLMRRVARAGLIESTDRSRNSERGHARNLRVWKSAVAA